jgi:low density lipoprotein receptor-related protein 5/6
MGQMFYRAFNEICLYFPLQTIVEASFNGSVVAPIVSVGLTDPKDIAIDWMARNIYWIDAGKKSRIQVARLDGSSGRVIVWKNLDSPRALAVDPLNGYKNF